MKIKKTLLVLLCLNFSLFPNSKILNINISGNKNVSIEKIFSLIKTKQGNEFDENIIKKDIETLIKTGYFKKINYFVEKKDEGVNIILLIEENPIIDKINFIGNKSLKTKKLKSILDISEGEILNKEKVMEGIKKIKDEYMKRGFSECEVDYQIEERDGKSILTVEIEEKGKIYIEKIIFEGNNSFYDKKLKKLMKTKERKMPFKRGGFKEDVLNQDLDGIKNFYKENGFIDIKVDKQIYYGEKGLIIKILIDEGKKYYVGDIKLDGNLIFKEEDIKKNILIKKGEPFNFKKNEETIRKIYQFYSDNGYIKCNVEYLPKISENIVNITYFINPEKEFYAEEIKIKGNKITKDKVIRREIKIEPGDKITGDKIRKSFNNLRDTNYFENIQIYPEIVEEDKANLVVDVKERERTGIFLIGGGYSTIDKFVGTIGLQQTNFDITNPPKFVGGGQNLSLMAEIGSTKRNYRFSFTEPYFLDRPISIGPDIYRLTSIWSDWTETATGFDLRIGRKWENFNLGFKFITENVELTDVDIPSEPEGKWRKNSIVTSFGYSNLDSERFPKKGDRFRFSVEYAGIGGDLNFIKTTLENHFYYPFNKFIFHSKTLAGYINKDVPIYERFFGGGIGTVRGYVERSLG
ncbi:MAG: outer membrane protein assembly factor BamA, partial [Candidatus Omnitrophica bacterium]|nr:outer membrane protein assembly factor BamA [Candidatus Omnitrophota bacterium]